MFGHFSKGLILSLLAGFASTAYADLVSVGDARQLAADFLMADYSGDQAQKATMMRLWFPRQ